MARDPISTPVLQSSILSIHSPEEPRGPQDHRKWQCTNRFVRWDQKKLIRERSIPRYRYKGSNRCFIYALIDPRDQTVRYVGLTNNPSKRLDDHCSEKLYKANFRLSAWIKGLVTKSMKPVMVKLGSTTPANIDNAERRWIAYFRERGDLYNIRDGGGSNRRGWSGKPKAENRAVGRIDHLGRFHQSVRDPKTIGERLATGERYEVDGHDPKPTGHAERQRKLTERRRQRAAKELETLMEVFRD